jgi:hypothetical protein
MASSTTRLIVVLIAAAIVVAWVALACEDCDSGARHLLRELARVVR